MLATNENVKVWFWSTIAAAAITYALYVTTNHTGVSFYKVVVIALLITLVSKTGYAPKT